MESRRSWGAVRLEDGHNIVAGGAEKLYDQFSRYTVDRFIKAHRYIDDCSCAQDKREGILARQSDTT
jgi:hypothetical protein